LRKKFHKSKFPQLLLPFPDVPVKPNLRVKGTKDNHLFFIFNEDWGRTQFYENSMFFKHGTMRSWDKHGKLLVVIPCDGGHQHGQQVHWYPDGSLKKIGNWDCGKMHGRWMEWFEDGVTSFQGHYRQGKKHGEWWEWYENGRLAVEANFLDGYALDLQVWKPNGEICEQSWVSSGYGQWMRYSPTGEIRDRSEISNGEIVYEEDDSEEEW
jgi:antitoxin component YwqK of YwqJK toxin-antitoxin module